MANRRQLYAYKGDCCAACGLGVQAMVEQWGTFHRLFELNHIDPKKKHPQYANLIRRSISTEQLEEIDKCVLLCRQCHGIVHAQNVNAELIVRLTFRNRLAEQRLRGQLILDKKSRRGKFLTNEQLLLQPYRVKLGSQRSQLLFGIELHRGRLIDLMANIRQHKRVRISAWNGPEQMSIEHRGENRIAVRQDIRFPITSCELSKEAADGRFIWVRNGIALTRDGEVIRTGELNYEGTIA